MLRLFVLLHGSERGPPGNRVFSDSGFVLGRF